jgi:biofilm PGA synthesis N-glycosyltransferase PgaC
MKQRRYLIVSPCRDEAQFMRRTLDSVTQQSVLPDRWVIVDDGSTDETPKILAEYAARFPFIQVVTRSNRGTRSVGPGVIDAFYAGLSNVLLDQFDYLCKLDLDLVLPVRYFEGLIEKMEATPRLGTCSGKAYYPSPSNVAKSFDGELISEGIADDVSVGASKFYRRSCFQQIGGFVRQVMWDGIDCHRCRMLGWMAESFDDAELRFIHLRPMGTSHVGMWTGRKRHGYGQYFMGSSLLFMTASAVYRLTKPPVVVGAVAMWWGYAQSLLRGESRYDDAEFRRFLRLYQKESLLYGKTEAVRRAHQRTLTAFTVPTSAKEPSQSTKSPEAKGDDTSPSVS